MKALVDKLPSAYHLNLQYFYITFIIILSSYLMKFLHLVASHSENNKMDENNLGIVIGPAILRKDLNVDDRFSSISL